MSALGVSIQAHDLVSTQRLAMSALWKETSSSAQIGQAVGLMLQEMSHGWLGNH